MLVARNASGKVGFAEVMAPMVRWRCQRQGSVASLERGISHPPLRGFEDTDLATLTHLEYPTVCHGHPCKSFYSRPRSSKLGRGGERRISA